MTFYYVDSAPTALGDSLASVFGADGDDARVLTTQLLLSLPLATTSPHDGDNEDDDAYDDDTGGGDDDMSEEGTSVSPLHSLRR